MASSTGSSSKNRSDSTKVSMNQQEICTVTSLQFVHEKENKKNIKQPLLCILRISNYTNSKKGKLNYILLFSE